MRKIAVGVLGPTLLIATVAGAQPVVESVVFGQGQQLYQDHCTLCHQDAGTGNPPTFPALSGNDRLGNPGRIVSTIRQGTGTMPPFPELSAAEISAVATYIRNAWANGFGGLTTADATAVLEGLEADGDLASVWDGVFTEGQAGTRPGRVPGCLRPVPRCSAPGFLDSGLTVFASMLPRPTRRSHVAPERGFDSGTSLASTARCTSA